MKDLVNVFYICINTGLRHYQCTTDDFDAWLEDHNAKRVADGEMEEQADDFETQDIELYVFNNVVS